MTKREWIISKLIEDGSITRNFALRNYISRLSGDIHTLKKYGFEFDTQIIEGTTPWGKRSYDYKYIATKIPKYYVKGLNND